MHQEWVTNDVTYVIEETLYIDKKYRYILLESVS